MSVLGRLPAIGSAAAPCEVPQLDAGGVNLVAAIVASLSMRAVTEGTGPLEEVRVIAPIVVTEPQPPIRSG
jgi:hypothetical protein